MHKLLSLLAGIILIGAAFSLLAVPKAVHAESFFNDSKNQACEGANVVGGGSCDTNAGNSFNNLLRTLLNLLSIIVGILAVVMVIVGGVKFMTSAGDSQKTASAKSTILYAVIGLLVVAFSQIIVKFVLTKTSG